MSPPEALRTEQRGRIMFWLSLFLSNYRWFRRWYGGKWALSYINLPLTNPFVWLPTWDRPGCGLYWLEREDHG